MHIIFAIPKIDNSGPSKGLVALANELIKSVDISILYFKKQDVRTHTEFSVNKKINVVNSNREIIKELNEKDDNVYLISMGFSSDFLSLFYFSKITKICFIRGNLFINYRYDYGVIGYILAFFHYFIIRFFDKCFVLNNEEQRRVRRLGINATIVPNCLDERTLGKINYNKNHKWDFIFVGNLNYRKRPDLMLKGLYQLSLKGLQLNAVIVGSGVMRRELQKLVAQLELVDQVEFVGQKESAYEYLSMSKVFVLPSISEGISRALMEAAHFGNISVIRDAECNSEFINEREGYEFFKDDSDISAKMYQSYKKTVSDEFQRKSFLPKHLKQKKIATLVVNELQKIKR